MKNLLKKSGFIILPAALILSVVSCSKSDTPAPVVNPNLNGNITLTTLQAQVDSLQKEPVSQTELNTILYMREEEKLARDVYTTLYNKWGSTIFTNISAAEQTHMDALLMLINKYSLTDPVGSNPVGVFSDTTLQNLYNQLVAQGNTSIPEAYITGATIEDLDIYDLNNAVTTIDNKDIILVYDNLTKGSRNHLRSFYQNILKVGATYTPQYLTQAEFDAIINSAMETGF
ncbi:MAG TPA: ferritin [Chitinophagaceae bacterium]|nr:ferritin [Chitinophagaceae bacterium]